MTMRIVYTWEFKGWSKQLGELKAGEWVTLANTASADVMWDDRILVFYVPIPVIPENSIIPL